MMSHQGFWALILCACLWSLPTFAQSRRAPAGDFDLEGIEKSLNYEFGAHVGNLLPNQIEGVTEILPQWGVRGGIRIADYAFVESGLIAGKGEGASWSNLHVSLRMNAPIETLMGIFFIGGDIHRYEPDRRKEKTFGGAHVGGGIMAPITRGLWFRADMKFNVNPGTSLYIGAGFMGRF